MLVKESAEALELTGLATAHSHAFQRGLRGLTHSGPRGSFWVWRDLMYQFAERLTPESLYALSRFAFAELALSGVTAVGEFHYVHHQVGGQPYEDRTLLAQTVVQAARDVGVRIALLRVLYHRPGASGELAPAQTRFSDETLDDALRDIDDLQSRYHSDPMVTVGIAPHSVRAVPRDWLQRAASFAKERGMVCHMHVAEQQKELEQCKAEHGVTPVQLLADDGVLGDSFVAVHATHLDESEIAALGHAKAMVCVCRTTERDLGDGSLSAQPLTSAGAALCVGVDSHASSDHFEEMRAVELDERVRLQARNVVCDGAALLDLGGANGYRAIGMEGLEDNDRVVLSRVHPSLVGAQSHCLEDAVAFSARADAVRDVYVGDRRIVSAGSVDDYENIRRTFEQTVASLVR